MAEESPDHLTILVTGFGKFLNIKENPSWQIVSRLPPVISHRGRNIKIITQAEPLKADYHHLFEVDSKLLQESNPDVVIHLGLAVDQNYFSIERGADRDIYHQFPDERRKVFTKTETKHAWGKSPSRLNSSLKLNEILERWKAQAGKSAEVKVTDDVGNYVCGFVYYTSLEYFWRKGRDLPVMFMHVPPLPRQEDVDNGLRVTTWLIKAVAESYE